MKQISKNCLNLVKEFEGLRLSSYRDEVGVWTIGYGITNADKSITGKTIKSGMTITKATAEKWLEESLNKKYLPKVMKYDKKYDWNQNELDALVSFCYNIGSIDGLTANGTRSKSVISNKLLEYNKAGGRVYNGLTRRRKAERELFLAQIFTITSYYDGKLTKPVNVLKRGCVSAAVGEVQRFIKWLYDCDITVDNVFGKVTEAWVIRFQTDSGISADGKWYTESYNRAKAITIRERFLAHMSYYNDYVKEHGKQFVKANDPDRTFADVKKKIEAGKTVNINCNAAIGWAFDDLGLNPSIIYANKNGFKDKFTGTMTEHLTRSTSVGAIGETVKNAVDHKLLKAGDIICFKNLTHTFVYTGTAYKCYEGGGEAQKNAYVNGGIMVDYSTSYKYRKISEILRWK